MPLSDHGSRSSLPALVPLDAEPHARVLTATFALG